MREREREQKTQRKRVFAKRANDRATEAAVAYARADMSNRHKTEWRKMVCIERRVNDLYFMPFFFIRALFYPLTCTVVACFGSLFAYSLTRSFRSVWWTCGRSLAALVLIELSPPLSFSFCYLSRLPTTSTIST